uniref:Reverse transcriptase domain-containing protein n=1 Tax=Chromera velia CCMP2878 TaxID=1169474 RepID=A0A0G4GJ00_9ALVE|eukprot:Cvel_22083.t1-p1 / transcript=Cvel_22083.t1 / gene=Cvel_22083 / organism=Chromera_velia_CCMP2878 / gene_product=hypothetical protein / transcript_product=hypothetical protein / location=Cvel_scaffold2134:32051-33580(+) / protein_length=510 / sequence_SO=supercontig / SO=protein_coding / is_pseudo=false
MSNESHLPPGPPPTLPEGWEFASCLRGSWPRPGAHCSVPTFDLPGFADASKKLCSYLNTRKSPWMGLDIGAVQPSPLPAGMEQGDTIDSIFSGWFQAVCGEAGGRPPSVAPCPPPLNSESPSPPPRCVASPNDGQRRVSAEATWRAGRRSNVPRNRPPILQPLRLEVRWWATEVRKQKALLLAPGRLPVGSSRPLHLVIAETHKKYREAKTAYNRALSAYVKSEAVERERVLQAELQKSPHRIYELLKDLRKRAAARLMPSRADDGTSAALTTRVPSPWAFAEHFAQVFRCPEESSPGGCCSGPLPSSSSLTVPGISVSTVSQNACAPLVQGLAPLSTEIPPPLQGSSTPLVPPPSFPPLSPLSDPPPQPEASDPRAPSGAWEATGRVSPFPDLEFFSQEEVKSCLRAGKKKKAAGVDGLMVENLRKWSQNPLFVASVTDVFNVCLVEGRIPSIWNRCLISPVLKPGKDPEDPASYRPIHLLGHLSKTFSSLVDQRLRKIVSLSRVQFGF